MFHQLGDHTGVVNVGVGQQQRINLAGGQRQLRVFEQVRALLHAVVNQNVVPACLQQGTGTCDLMTGT